MKDFATEPAVYGIVLVAGLVAISADGADESWSVLVKVVTTVLVFWAAHVYAGAVAHIGEDHDSSGAVRARLVSALAQSFNHSWGMIGAVLLPVLALLLGVVELITHQQAVWGTLWVSVVLLGVLGYVKVAAWSDRPAIRLASAAATSTLGIALILLKTLVH